MKITNKKSYKIPIILAVLLIIIGTGTIFFFVYKGNSNENFTTTRESGGGITSGKEAKKDSDKSTPTPDTDITPTTPIGTFVSNHRPNLSGSPAPNTMTSTCSTTPGSKCTIEFTKGNITKSLPNKIADGNGNISWDWELQDVGLTVGEWQVTAVASNGNNIAKASDSIPLIVGD